MSSQEQETELMFFRIAEAVLGRTPTEEEILEFTYHQVSGDPLFYVRRNSQPIGTVQKVYADGDYQLIYDAE